MSLRLLKNEEDTKLKIVYNYLKSLGFDDSELFYEESFFLKVGRFTFRVDTGEQISTLQPRLDILVKRGGKNLCIVEVKDGRVVVSRDDIDQAVSYGRLVDPIAPICIITNGRDWRLVDTITKKDITKDSLPDPSSYVPSLPESEYYEALQHFLGYSQENLRTFCAEQVDRYMEPLKGSSDDRDKKFIPDLYEVRHDVQSSLDQFLESQSSCFAVVGDSGRGKTCWICDSALRYLEQGRVVFFYRGKDVEDGIFRALSDDLNWSFSSHVDEAQGIKRLLGLFKQEDILIFVDSLDEMASHSAGKVLDTFLRRVEGARVKLIATCKSEPWGNLLENDGIPTLLSSRVFKTAVGHDAISNGFEEQEFISVVNKYRQFYNYTGSFESSVFEACRRDPFLLRIMFEVASQNHLPYIGYSAIEFYRSYADKLTRRFGASRHTLQRLLTGIAKCFFVHNSEEIDIDVILEDLHISANESIPTIFFDLGVLERFERNDVTYVRFYFEKLRDYLIAFRAFKWHELSTDGFAKATQILEMRSVHLDTLNLYYSLANDEHKRVLDEPLYENATHYVQVYQYILNTHFMRFKDRFLPHTTGRIGFWGSIDLARREITWHAVRPIRDTDDPVVLLPAAKGVTPFTDNSAFLRGALSKSWTTRAKGFKDRRAVEQAVWEEVRSTLDEIIKQGRLDESNNGSLLIERVIAISFSRYNDYFLSKGALTSYLPIELEDLREYILYTIDRDVLMSRHVNTQIDQGKAEETWDGNILIHTVSFPPEVLEELEAHAWAAAKRGEDLSRSDGEFMADPSARLLLEDIDGLMRLGVTRIQNSPLIDWYVAQHIDRSFVIDTTITAELEGLLPYLYRAFLDEYRTFVETNFPTLSRDFRTYRELPLRAVIAIETDKADERPLSLATLPIEILEYRLDDSASNQVQLSDVDALEEELSRWRTDPNSKVLRHIGTGTLLWPYQNYMPIEGIDKHLCLLRHLVYQTIQEDARSAFDALRPKPEVNDR